MDKIDQKPKIKPFLIRVAVALAADSTEKDILMSSFNE